MRLTLDEDRETDAADLDGRVARSEVLAAVRGERAWLDCPEPGPLFERVGAVTPELAVRPRTALAVAARSRGVTAPQDEEIRRLRSRLEPLDGDDDDVETATHRRRLAETSEGVDRLRERVARLQGRIAALREHEDGSSDAEADLTTALTALTEHETEQVAARQALDHARERRRDRHDRREERRRLDDRLANRERAARRHLVERVEPEFRAAVGALDGPDARETPFEASPVTAALAVYRVGDPAAPVVLDCDRFPDARTAADWLDTAVLRV
ncbi:DUF7856 family protein [Halomarina oriensis]|uniref:Uncharacterized protein n=1 Tax=Halomarina oriensis TaxID=671145 RepID=A0A6B0GIA2_9EURY|nr:hypothetical protein [Halomarina oriensis]MWG34596.1 hypothetical protein [Halomarina oriensis]